MSLSRTLFSYEGRIPRSTFWYYLVAATVVWLAGRMADAAISGQAIGSGYGCITVFLTVLTIATGLAVGVKRCHDRDRSGWYLLWGLIPILGEIWLLIELGFRKGTPGQNLYGPDPLAAKNSTAASA